MPRICLPILVSLLAAAGCSASSGPHGAGGTGGTAGAAAGETAAGSGGTGAAGRGPDVAGSPSGGAGGRAGSTSSVPPRDAGMDSAAPPDADDAGEMNGSYASQPLAAAPHYQGSIDGSAACSKSYATTGFEPVDPSHGRHPLFLYFVGTIFVSSDASSKYDCQAGSRVTEAMARRGFVAVSVEYDNGFNLALNNKLACLFGPANADNLLAKACALPQVDCDKGIATWGHSQGALVAHSTFTFEPRVRAVWTTGYGGAPINLPKDRIRVVNGEADTMNAAVGTLNSTAGFTASECPDDGRKQCLRDDGSGWIIVQKKDCKATAADHCWFSKVNCGANDETLEPNWTDPSATTPFALEANADWVARTVARP